MANVLLQHAEASGGGGGIFSQSCQWNSNVTAGTLMLALVSQQNATYEPVSSVTDTLGNTYSKACGGVGNNSSGAELWYCVNAFGGGTRPTVTAAFSGRALGTAHITLVEYSGPTGLRSANWAALAASSPAVSNSIATAAGDDFSARVLCGPRDAGHGVSTRRRRGLRGTLAPRCHGDPCAMYL